MSTTLEIKSERAGYCRICQCLEDENMFDMLQGFKDVMENENELPPTCESFTRTTGITICPDDEHSRFVCENCYTSLKDFLILRQEAEASRQKNTETQNLRRGSLETSLEQIKVEKEEAEQQCLICMGYDDEMTDIFSDIQFEVDIGNVNKLSHIFEEVLGISPSDYARADKLICGGCVNRLTKSCMLRHQALKSDEKEPFEENIIEIKQENINCQICFRAFTEQMDYETHLPCINQTAPDKSYNCPICAKSFPRFYPLKIHMLVHSTERSYVCNICSKAFRCQTSLNCHLQTVHSNNRPHACEICSKRFKTSSGLLRHFRTHNTEKSFVCKICSKAFNQANYLLSHLKSHSNERSYSCEMCPKAFKNLSNLHTHKKTHLDERPYKCHLCPKAFKLSSILKVHMVVHSSVRPYTCKICSKSYKQESYLSHHMKIHLDERPYQCKICSKTFKYTRNLRDHMKTHSSERTHVCKVCSKSLKSLSSLNCHLQTVHSNNRPHVCKVCSKKFKMSSALLRHLRIHNTEKSLICESFKDSQ